jgi:hypothetical protein
MFERFTDKARKVVVEAKAEATEHGDDRSVPYTCCTGWPPPTA